MSSDSNKLLCAILSAFLVYLLASFVSELFYSVDKKKVKLSYNLETKTQDLDEAVTKMEIKKISESEINQLLEKANLEKGKSFVDKNCSSCHDLDMPIKNKIGPSLATILNRKIGSLEDYKFSKALLSNDKEWNILNLYYFLEKPKEWAPGTKMSYRGISDSTKLLNTIKYLRQNSLNNEN